MKKKKQKKPSDKKIIKDLRESREKLILNTKELENEIEEWEKADRANREEITGLLMTSPHNIIRSNFGRDISSDRFNWKQIKNRISFLQGQVTKEGEVARWFDRSREDEIKRLWHVIRVVVGDKNVKPEIDPVRNTDIFGGQTKQDEKRPISNI